MELCVRAASDADLAFIHATWKRQIIRCGVRPRSELSERELYTKATHVVNALLHRSATLIACLPDDPSVILGYLVVELSSTVDKPIIHFCYTKGPWRGMGVMRLLFKDLHPNNCYASHLTKSLKLKNFPGLVFKPELAKE